MGRAPWRGRPEEDLDDEVVAEAMTTTDVTHLADRAVRAALRRREGPRTSFARVLAQQHRRPAARRADRGARPRPPGGRARPGPQRRPTPVPPSSSCCTTSASPRPRPTASCCSTAAASPPTARPADVLDRRPAQRASTTTRSRCSPTPTPASCSCSPDRRTPRAPETSREALREDRPVVLATAARRARPAALATPADAGGPGHRANDRGTRGADTDLPDRADRRAAPASRSCGAASAAST